MTVSRLRSRRQNRRRSRRATPSRAVVFGALPAILAMTATSPRLRSTGARSPAIIARVVVMRNGAVRMISRRTRRRPRYNRRRGRRRGPRRHNRRTPRPSTVELYYQTACPAAAGRGTWRRAARPALDILTGALVRCRTACMASGRTAGGSARTKGRATSWSWIIRASRRRSLHQSRRRTRRANQILRGASRLTSTRLAPVAATACWWGPGCLDAIDAIHITQLMVHRTQAGALSRADARAHDGRHDRQ